MERPVILREKDAERIKQRQKTALRITIASGCVIGAIVILFALYMAFAYEAVKERGDETNQIAKKQDQMRALRKDFESLHSNTVELHTPLNQTIEVFDATVKGIQSSINAVQDAITVSIAHKEAITDEYDADMQKLQSASNTLSGLESSNSQATNVLNSIQYLDSLTTFISTRISSILQGSTVMNLYNTVTHFSFDFETLTNIISDAKVANQQSVDILSDVQTIQVFQSTSTAQFTRTGYVCIGSIPAPQSGAVASASGTFDLVVNGITSRLYAYADWDGNADLSTSHTATSIQVVTPQSAMLNVINSGQGGYIGSTLLSNNQIFQSDGGLHLCVSGIVDEGEYTLTINTHQGNSWLSEARTVDTSGYLPVDTSNYGLVEIYGANSLYTPECYSFTVPCSGQIVYKGRTAVDAIAACTIATRAAGSNYFTVTATIEAVTLSEYVPEFQCIVIPSLGSATPSTACSPYGIGYKTNQNFYTTSRPVCGSPNNVYIYTLM